MQGGGGGYFRYLIHVMRVNEKEWAVCDIGFLFAAPFLCLEGAPLVFVSFLDKLWHAGV